MALEVIPLGTVAPYPKGDCNCSGYLINYNGYKYMFDCGNGCTSKLDMINDLKNLKVFITHMHADHFGDIPCLATSAYVLNNLGIIDSDIEVYIPEGEKVLETHYIPSKTDDPDDWGDYSTTYVSPIENKYLRGLEKEYPIDFNEYNYLNYKDKYVKIISQRVPHQIDAYAFKLITPEGTIVYSGDCGPNNDLDKFAKNADLFICESSFIRGQYRKEPYHLYAYEAAQIAKKAHVKNLLLTHFFPEVEKEKYLNEAKEIFSNVEVAEEGKKLILRGEQNGK